MATVHRLVGGAFALALDPLLGLPPLAGLCLVSAAAGVVILVGMRLSSNPQAIRSAKQKVQAHLLATRLYRHELLTVWRSLGALLGALARYMMHMLRPFIALLIPFALLFAQLEARYASRPLQPGEQAIVKVTPTDATPPEWRLEAPPGVAVDSVSVRVPSRHEINWRVRAEAPGSYNLTLHAGSDRVVKTLQVGGSSGATAERAQASLSALFSAPAEAPIDSSSAVQSIEVEYPSQSFKVYGWRLHWIVVFLIVSTAVALLLRKRAGVEF